KWTERCIQQGVGVLIMPFDDGDTVSQHKLNKLVEVLPATGDPAGAALQIGAAAVKALESIGNRR
ncbi:MAG TPA: hypothetical protein VGP24_12910, partial [Glaciihabitans sp.]|nr:hypothetical protein [Glaciihabitans sp.]